MDRRNFVRTTAAGVAAAATPASLQAASRPDASIASGPGSDPQSGPAVHLRRTRPLCIADVSSVRYTNGGTETGIERAYRGITEGEDMLDAMVAGVNIPELDPEERGIGYGGLPNADGVVQLDSCLMHGPRHWAGGVAGIEGIRTPSLVAKAVAELTDHHLAWIDDRFGSSGVGCENRRSTAAVSLTRVIRALFAFFRVGWRLDSVKCALGGSRESGLLTNSGPPTATTPR